MAKARIEIDGATGEGGGQMLRTSLALAVCLGRPLEMRNIRAARSRPGLQPQHLAAVRAAASICHANVTGDQRDSQTLTFTPQRVSAGDFRFDVGTAGSTSLVLQTVLPPLMLADAPSRLTLQGGTHNPFAPPLDFLQLTFLPLLNRMGPKISATLERAGFAPKGGGRVDVHIQPSTKLRPLALKERGAVLHQYAQVLLANLPAHIARRELATIEREMDYTEEQLIYRSVEAYGPGNVVNIVINSEHVTECFSAFGQRGLPAEKVALDVAAEAQHYLAAGVPVGRRLADQLLVPLALAGAGEFVTLKPSSHLLTNIDVIQSFMDVEITTTQLHGEAWLVRVSGRSTALA